MSVSQAFEKSSCSWAPVTGSLLFATPVTTVAMPPITPATMPFKMPPPSLKGSWGTPFAAGAAGAVCAAKTTPTITNHAIRTVAATILLFIFQLLPDLDQDEADGYEGPQRQQGARTAGRFSGLDHRHRAGFSGDDLLLDGIHQGLGVLHVRRGMVLRELGIRAAQVRKIQALQVLDESVRVGDHRVQDRPLVGGDVRGRGAAQEPLRLRHYVLGVQDDDVPDLLRREVRPHVRDALIEVGLGPERLRRHHVRLGLRGLEVDPPGRRLRPRRSRLRRPMSLRGLDGPEGLPARGMAAPEAGHVHVEWREGRIHQASARSKPR